MAVFKMVDKFFFFSFSLFRTLSALKNGESDEGSLLVDFSFYDIRGEIVSKLAFVVPTKPPGGIILKFEILRHGTGSMFRSFVCINSGRYSFADRIPVKCHVYSSWHSIFDLRVS